ncbi:MAG: glycosyltransferase family 87 protein [Bacteroidota bacterium]|nr:glycosyltransferase family 87 protein [Bacteroidota bacterium]
MVVAITTIFVLILIPSALRSHGPLAIIARYLPQSFDSGFKRRPVLATLVAVLALIALVQIARLSCFMSNPELRWGSAYPPVEFGVRHQCFPAYIYAAELNRNGHPNIYSEEHYPAYHIDHPETMRPISTEIINLEPHIRDAFEYPPPFLLLPRIAIALTNDFLVMRTGWFMIQVILFVAVAIVVAQRVGERRGTVAGILMAGLLSSFPFMFNFQFGQFHLATIMLAIGGMMAFDAGRNKLGGALLAGAIVTKIFPGIFLIYLAVRRQNRPIMWTLIFACVYTFVAILVVGVDPFYAFFDYHLPRVMSGEAFSFFLKTNLTLAANTSVYSIPFKLERLGVPGMSAEVASWLVWLYTVLLIGATVIAARRPKNFVSDACVWLGLLALCSLRSPDAPNVYVGTSALWLLTLLAVETRGNWKRVLLLVIVWLCVSVQPPLPNEKATIALWMSGQIAILILGFWVVLRWRGGYEYNSTASTSY